METTAPKTCSKAMTAVRIIFMAVSIMTIACDAAYDVDLTYTDCNDSDCVRPPNGRAASFVLQSHAPSEDGVVVTINGEYAERIDRAGNQWLITARQSWAELGEVVQVQVKGYWDCKIRCERWHSQFTVPYAEHSWAVSAMPFRIAPDAFALPVTGHRTVLVQREPMGSDGAITWSVRGEFPFDVYPGAPWPMFVDAFGRPGVLDPDTFGRTEPASLWRDTLPQGVILGRLDQGVYVVQGARLLYVEKDEIIDAGPAPATTVVLAGRDSLWLVLRDSALLQHLHNGLTATLPDTAAPLTEILSGPAHALVYERVIATSDADKPYSWQRYALGGGPARLLAEVSGYEATVSPDGLGVLESSLAQLPGDTQFGFAVGESWIWVSDGIASYVPNQFWRESHTAVQDGKVRDW